MSPDPAQWKLPVLAVLTEPGLHIHGIRELSNEEQTNLENFTKIAAAAINRFKLFTILKKNYQEWWNFTQSLLSPGGQLVDDEMLELDRLLMNFLSSAKSVLEHFQQEWTQKFRKTERQDDFKNFIKRLEDGCWAFAFFQDLRNFTQHCGLPVGRYSRNSTVTSVNLAVQADAEWLIKSYSRWDKSKLTKDQGRFDLITLSHDYHLRIEQDLGNFVATAFAPNLFEAHSFFAGLANEAREANPKGHYRIISELNIRPDGFDFQFKMPPADLLGAIGIVARPAQPKKPSAEPTGAGQPATQSRQPKD